jgi:hypothetical protein
LDTDGSSEGEAMDQGQPLAEENPPNCGNVPGQGATNDAKDRRTGRRLLVVGALCGAVWALVAMKLDPAQEDIGPLGGLLPTAVAYAAIGMVTAVWGGGLVVDFARWARAVSGGRPWREARDEFACLILVAAGVFVMLLYFGRWFSGAAVHHPMVSPAAELPLSDLRGIAVDEEGRIYCASHLPGRIQVYDRRGRFLRGWHVRAWGAFWPRVNGAGRVEVALARSDQLLTYEPDGTLVRETDCEWEDMERDFFVNEDSTIGPDGSVYTVRGRLTWPRVTRTDPSGVERDVIVTRLSQWLFLAPLPVLPFCVVGMILIAIGEKYRKRLAARNGKD